MAADHPDEVEEWLTGRVETWVETYKKAMLTPVVLHLVATHQPVTVSDLTLRLGETTGWQLTERGLYRTVKRLQDSGFLVNDHVDAPRTGAKRKLLSLSPVGAAFLDGIRANLVRWPEQDESDDSQADGRPGTARIR